MKKKITGKYCFFATHVTSNDESGNDCLYAKVRTRYDDGTESSDLVAMDNYPRTFYISKPAIRKTHKTKKEYELLENLDSYSCTQAGLRGAIASVTKQFGKRRLSDLLDSPYIYGADITTESLYKKHLADKSGDYAPKADVAALDYETNVRSLTEEIISGSVTFKDKAIIAISKEWLGSTPLPEDRLREAINKHIGSYVEGRNINIEIAIVANDLEVVKTLIGKLHKWKPDFVSVWNLPFDMNKMLYTFKRHAVPPEDVFSDPSVPYKNRYFNWREGKSKKETASGKVTSKHMSDLWHIAKFPATFYFIDSMCFFKKKRPTEKARHSYSLDSILEEELKISKLQVKGAEHLGTQHNLEWHEYMQKNLKIEYLVYNIFDCIALELLDEKTRDISLALPALVGISPVECIASPPRNLANNFHFFLLDRGKVVCSTGTSMVEEYDKYTINMRGHILTLSSTLNIAVGAKIGDDDNLADSRIYTQNFDIDIESGYPTTGEIMNVAKETTEVEVSSIDGVTEADVRRCGVNLTAIKNNSVDICSTILKMPCFEEVLDMYEAQHPMLT